MPILPLEVRVVEVSPSALIDACIHGDIRAVRTILSHGVDVHICDELALCQASYCGHIDVVEVLLDHGADAHGNCDMPIRWARVACRHEIVKLLLLKSARKTRP